MQYNLNQINLSKTILHHLIRINICHNKTEEKETLKNSNYMLYHKINKSKVSQTTKYLQKMDFNFHF